MEITEIKKALYQEKPKAFLNYIRKGHAYYTALLNKGSVMFEVPVSDMGDADFHATMEAKLLIRWIVKTDL